LNGALELGGRGVEKAIDTTKAVVSGDLQIGKKVLLSSPAVRDRITNLQKRFSLTGMETLPPAI